MKSFLSCAAGLFLLCAPIGRDTGFLLAGKDENVEKKPAPKFTVGKETTYVTGPLDKDGYIDYAAALNQQLGKGITSKNNANVLLWEAWGPHPLRAVMPAEFFELMGIAPPPERGDYFIDLTRYAKEHLRLEPGDKTVPFFEEHGRAAKRPWTAKQYPQVAGWLKANQKPLAVAAEAARCSDYFNPLMPRKTDKGPGGLTSVYLPGASTSLELANALAARAMLHAGEGRIDEAWQDLLACHRLGLLVGRGGTIVEGNVGNSISQSIASAASVAFLGRVRLNSKQAQACLRDLQQLPARVPVADKIALAERFMFLDCVQMIHRYGLEYLKDGSFAPPKDPDPKKVQAMRNIDWDPVLRNANRWHVRIATALRIKDRADREKQMEALDKELRTLKENAVVAATLAKVLLRTDTQAVGKAIGDILIGMMVPAFTKLKHYEDRSEQMQRNLHLAFALAAFECDRGAYPKQLSELAPKYLPRIPNDLFSGKAPIYRPEEKGYLLYSVGLNGKDEGGRSSEDGPPGDDIAVRIPLPELKRQE